MQYIIILWCLFLFVLTPIVLIRVVLDNRKK